MTNEELEAKILKRVSEMYVSKVECGEKNQLTELHVQKLEITMAKVSTKLSVMIGILGAIGVAILSVIVKFIF